MCEKIILYVFMSKQLCAIYLLKKYLFFSSFPLDSVIRPLVSRQPYHWMFEGYARVIVQSQKATSKDTLAISFKGLDHLLKVTFKRVIEGLRSLISRASAKASPRSRDMTVFVPKATREVTLEVWVCKVTCVSVIYFELGFARLFFSLAIQF